MTVFSAKSQRVRFLEKALATISDGIVIVDNTGQVVFINEACQETLQSNPLLKKPAEQHTLDIDVRFLDGRKISREETPIGRALGGESVSDFRMLLLQPGGKEVYLNANSRPIMDDKDTIEGAICVFRDITELMNSEIERERSNLQKMEQQGLIKVPDKSISNRVDELEDAQQYDSQQRLFQSIINNTPVGVMLLRGPDLIIEMINQTLSNTLQKEAFTFIGRTFTEVWPDETANLCPLLRSSMLDRTTYHFSDLPLRQPSSPDSPFEERFFSCTFVPMPGEGGMPDGIVLFSLETTHHVQAQKKIAELAEVARQRASELETIIESIGDPVLIWDKNGHLVDFNEAGLKLLSLPRFEDTVPSDVDYMRLLNPRHPDGRRISREDLVLTRALKGEVVRDHEEIIQDLSTLQDVYVLLSAAPIFDRKKEITGAVVVLCDITGLKELDKLKDQFIATAAHELKTPLTIMKGYSQSLLREVSGIPLPRRRALEAIDRGADRIHNIVNELLDVSRLQSGQLELSLERINLQEFAEQAIDRIAMSTNKHQMRFFGVEPVVIRGDQYRLEQVMLNLLDNAVRYSPHGGNIDVRVAVRDHKVILSVRDHGVGIPRGKQTRIFERFYRAHVDTPFDYGGMGVGLYISREIIARHGGEMWFKSEEDKGSTFYFSLPV